MLRMERNIASQVSTDFVYQLLLIGTVSTAFCEGRGVFSESWYYLLASDALPSLVTFLCCNLDTCRIPSTHLIRGKILLEIVHKIDHNTLRWSMHDP